MINTHNHGCPHSANDTLDSRSATVYRQKQLY
jgi:hypothetical protein